MAEEAQEDKHLDLESFFSKYKEGTSAFMLAIGTPLEDGTMTCYFHPDHGEGSTVDFAVKGNSLYPLSVNIGGPETRPVALIENELISKDKLEKAKQEPLFKNPPKPPKIQPT